MADQSTSMGGGYLSTKEDSKQEITRYHWLMAILEIPKLQNGTPLETSVRKEVRWIELGKRGGMYPDATRRQDWTVSMYCGEHILK